MCCCPKWLNPNAKGVLGILVDLSFKASFPTRTSDGRETPRYRYEEEDLRANVVGLGSGNVR